MKDWFVQLTQREQLSVLILGLALLLYVVYLLLWSPLDNMRDAMAQQNRGVAASLQRVDTMVSELVQLRASGGNSGGTSRNLTALVNQSTGRWQLQVSRLQPNSRGEIQVRLENAVFDDVMSWLHEMEFREALVLREVSITQAGTVGQVNVTVRIAQAG
tara:strand:- start:164250 stop:164726 length:477 start_codon:yes stop_codon:yes gene_type:complete